MAEMLKRYFNTEAVHLSEGRFWKNKCGGADANCGVCKYSHTHSENDAEFRKLMMQCNRTSLNANVTPSLTPSKRPFTPSYYDGGGAYTNSSSSRTVTGGRDPPGDEERGDLRMLRQVDSESEGDYQEEREEASEEDERSDGGGTEEEAEEARVEALRELATKYEFHHLEEYVTHLQVVYGHPDPYEAMEIGQT